MSSVALKLLSANPSQTLQTARLVPQNLGIGSTPDPDPRIRVRPFHMRAQGRVWAVLQTLFAKQTSETETPSVPRKRPVLWLPGEAMSAHSRGTSQNRSSIDSINPLPRPEEVSMSGNASSNQSTFMTTGTGKTTTLPRHPWDWNICRSVGVV